MRFVRINGLFVKMPNEDSQSQSGDFYNVRKVAEELDHCSTRTIYRYVQEKLLPPPLKIGGRSRWLKKDVESFIAKLEKKRHRKP
jgi:predicted DNA-binding transcriptional regulator AlpA